MGAQPKVRSGKASWRRQPEFPATHSYACVCVYVFTCTPFPTPSCFSLSKVLFFLFPHLSIYLSALAGGLRDTTPI